MTRENRHATPRAGIAPRPAPYSSTTRGRQVESRVSPAVSGPVRLVFTTKCPTCRGYRRAKITGYGPLPATAIAECPVDGRFTVPVPEVS